MDTTRKSIRPILPHAVRSAWYAFGIWFRLSIVGLGMLAMGVALLLERISRPAPGLTWIVAGGAVAALSWRFSQAALRRLDRAEQMGGHSESTDNARIEGHALGGTTDETLFGLSARKTALG